MEETEYALAEQDEKRMAREGTQVRDEAEKMGMAYNVLSGDMDDNFLGNGDDRSSQGGLSLK